MTFEGEFSSIGVMDVFKDKNLQECLKEIDQEFSNLNIKETDINFKNFDTDLEVSENFDNVIAIDGSITKPLNDQDDPITYSVVRVSSIEFNVEDLPNINISKTYDLDELHGWVDNVESVNIPFIRFNDPEKYPPFESFIQKFISDINIYETAFGELMEDLIRINIENDDRVNAVCSNCMESNDLTKIPEFCIECSSKLNQYSPLRFYNGYQTSEFMGLFENLYLLDILKNKNNTLVIKDGPMAQSRAPSSFIKQTFQNVYQKDSSNEVIGIEKTGIFQDELVDKSSDVINSPSISPIPENVLNSIRSSSSDALYGERTHFGKRFYMCPNTDMRYTVYVPRLNKHEKDTLDYKIEDYEKSVNIAFACTKKFKSKRYPNSFLPLIIANEHASLKEDAPYNMWISDILN